MLVIEKIAEMQSKSNDLKKNGKTIAFVPTMGYLHEGHLGLMRYGKELADVVIASIFVNPTQFGPNEDFEKYPRDFERDKTMAESAGVEYLFYPAVEEMYPGSFNTMIKMSGITDKFEGKTRPGHFDGVATVVLKLFNAVLPDIAIFGQKDFQQTAVIRQLVRDFNIPVNIVVAPTKREEDGLAMSSRNVYLPSDLRQKASIIYSALNSANALINQGEKKRLAINEIMKNKLAEVSEIRLDYACAVTADSMEEPDEFNSGESVALIIACYLGKTRLIDNKVLAIP